MCDGKVKLDYDRAVIEALLQQSHRPHYTWHAYDCLWCDFAHIGRAGPAPGHDVSCEAACAQRARHAKEWRIIEGIW